MDNQRALLLNWSCLYQEKSMDELKQNLLLAMELEETRFKAQEELKMRDEQIAQLKELLGTAIKERNEAQEKCQKMFLEKILLQQQLQKWQQSAQHSGISSIEDDPKRGIDSNNGFSSSDCDESIVSPPPPVAAVEEELELPIAINRALPEKGKLLQAVMKAGPLLQTLLLAGPLPQWRHPPPPLDSYQIPPPPVVIPPPRTPPPLPTPSIFQDPLQSINNCGRITRKRGLSEGSDSSNELKYQRVVLQ
ncbi:hypothetical protein CDL12_17818 [Handroanthus impetiginosus]|uniref:Uncharacterized protein n=1 Tax=Handroanthus impetiginosus TaxID=429701 RepID=A0A2G9GX76_9LAMI|nr:hypothetical protein CDL12_17818 [Handroanthus impetiginosus]